MATAVLGAVLAGAGAAEAAEPQIFPVEPHLVPFVVAGAFVLPAAIAATLSIIRRLARSPTALVGGGVLALAAAVVAAQSPGLRAVVGV